MSKIDLNTLKSELASLEKRAEKLKKSDMEDNPGKWEKFWHSLVGDVEHKWTKCYNKLKKHMSDENAKGECGKLKSMFG